jgi:hypothetical protein
MTARLHDRLFALSGVLFVVLELGGAFIAMGSGKTHDLTVSRQPSPPRCRRQHSSTSVSAGSCGESRERGTRRGAVRSFRK